MRKTIRLQILKKRMRKKDLYKTLTSFLKMKKALKIQKLLNWQQARNLSKSQRKRKRRINQLGKKK
jgi:hypothetical protein